VQRALDAGARIAEFPTTEAAARAAREVGLAVLMGAPNLLRGSSSSGNLSAVETLRLGLLDGLVSDYYPEAIWPAVLRGGLSLTDAVGFAADSPARAAGLDDRGRIEPGHRADPVALRPDGTVVRTIVAGRVVL
jgi:alpha-D-ribose 1-methylphosphonate 5-triphosphate diphosphatase